MKSTRTLAPAVPVRPAVATSAALLLAFTLFVPLTAAEDPHGHELMPLTGRNVDARISLNQNLRHNPTDVQNEAVKRLQHELPDVMVRFEPTTGATRTLSRPVGFLTHELRSDDPKTVALEFVTRHLATLGLEAQFDRDGEPSFRKRHGLRPALPHGRVWSRVDRPSPHGRRKDSA